MPVSEFHRHMRSLLDLKQTGTVAEYTATFWERVHRVLDLNSTLSIKCFVHQYVEGLRTDIQAAVRSQSPSSITRASSLARIKEDEIVKDAARAVEELDDCVDHGVQGLAPKETLPGFSPELAAPVVHGADHGVIAIDTSSLAAPTLTTCSTECPSRDTTINIFLKLAASAVCDEAIDIDTVSVMAPTPVTCLTGLIHGDVNSPVAVQMLRPSPWPSFVTKCTSTARSCIVEPPLCAATAPCRDVFPNYGEITLGTTESKVLRVMDFLQRANHLNYEYSPRCLFSEILMESASIEEKMHMFSLEAGHLSLFLWQQLNKTLMADHEYIMEESISFFCTSIYPHLIRWLVCSPEEIAIWDPGIHLVCWWVSQYFKEYVLATVPQLVQYTRANLQVDHTITIVFSLLEQWDMSTSPSEASPILMNSKKQLLGHSLSRIPAIEHFTQWDPGIVKILLRRALAMPDVGNLSGTLTDGVTAASAREQTFNVSKCKTIYSLVHLTSHLWYKQWDIGLQQQGRNNYALVLPWRGNGFSPGKCEHQHDLRRENLGFRNNEKISENTRQFELFLDPYLLQYIRWHPPDLVFALQQLYGIIRLCDPSVSSYASWVQNFIRIAETILFHPITNLSHALMVQEDVKSSNLNLELCGQRRTIILQIVLMYAISTFSPSPVIILVSYLKYRPWNQVFGGLLSEECRCL